jgi:hypothetical protein
MPKVKNVKKVEDEFDVRVKHVIGKDTFGYCARVIKTRTREQAKEFVHALEAAGVKIGGDTEGQKIIDEINAQWDVECYGLTGKDKEVAEKEIMKRIIMEKTGWEED